MPIDPYSLFYQTYTRLPSSVQDAVLDGYQRYVSRLPIGPVPKRDFVTQFFESREEYRRYENEYYASDIEETVERAREEHHRRTGHGRFAGLNTFSAPRYYALVRKLAPEVVIETGVCNGVSTLCVLAAVEQNGTGHLYSIDLPDADRLPADEQPGWIIPDALRENWELVLGRSQEKLPDVLSELEHVDLFLHDSVAAILDDEVEIVWPKLRTGAPILADDIYNSDAFSEIARTYDVTTGHVAPNVGYIVKNGE